MTTTADTAAETFEAAWNQWHGERERSYADPLGWVSLTGLYWLTDEFETVADLPGRWRADADAVYVQGIDGTDRLEPIEGAPGLLVEAGDRRIEVIRRTGSAALRAHDPKSPAPAPRTRSRRRSRRAPSSKDSSTTSTPLASSTSNWPAPLCSSSRSVGARVGCRCCSPMAPAA